jgi:hypothetical protein
MAPTIAAVSETRISASHSHIPQKATNNLVRNSNVKPLARGKGNIRKVNGEKDSERPVAASGIPQPFQRFQRGRLPSFQAWRTAFCQGAICVTASLKFSLYRVGVETVLQGGSDKA